MKKLLFALILTLPYLSCKTQEKISSPDTYEREIISFGSGGGFTGEVKSYSILRNGQMFKNGSEVSGVASGELTKLEDKIVDQLFLNFVNLKLAEIKLDDPGNMYRFINYKENGNIHRIQWGGMKEEVPKNIKTFYKILNQLATKNKGILR